MQDNLNFEIRKQFNLLRRSEQRVAEVILSGDLDFELLTIEEFSDICNVSQATIIRFAKAIGVKGYKELKNLLIKDKLKNSTNIVNANKLLSFPISKDDKIRDVPAKVITTSINILEDTLKTISIYEYTRAIEAITRASKISIYGVENSSAVMNDLATKLIYIGLNCNMYADPYLQNVSANNLQSGDVAIGISYTGCSRHTVDSLSIAKSKHATTIAITNYENSLINKFADIVLCASQEQYMYGNAIFSRTSQTAIVDMLYTGIILSDYDRYIKSIEENGNAIRSFAYEHI